jgi:hypothetical protein
MSKGPAKRPPCTICRQAVPPRDENPAFPFCSSRCQLIDLGRWLDGEYRVPAPISPEDADLVAADFDDEHRRDD